MLRYVGEPSSAERSLDSLLASLNNYCIPPCWWQLEPGGYECVCCMSVPSLGFSLPVASDVLCLLAFLPLLRFACLRFASLAWLRLAWVAFAWLSLSVLWPNRCGAQGGLLLHCFPRYLVPACLWVMATSLYGRSGTPRPPAQPSSSLWPSWQNSACRPGL